jgi:cytochrome c556
VVKISLDRLCTVQYVTKYCTVQYITGRVVGMQTDDRNGGTRNQNGKHKKAKNRERRNAMHRGTGLMVGLRAMASTVLLGGFLVLMALLSTTVVIYAGVDNLPQATRDVAQTLSLPGSLDALYPPAADRPVFLIRMLALDTSFSGIVVDLTEGDLDGAKGSFEDFRKQYREVAAMVPEWNREYPEQPVEDLGTALAAGDRDRAMNAFAGVGGICHRCHVAAMVPVQQKYHWGNFGAITIKDPLSGETTDYAAFKKVLSANLAGITVDLRQGQTDNARKQFDGFRARFDALGGSCQGCHEKESSYFTGREMQDAVARLGKAVHGRTVDVDAVTALTQSIGRESCSKCHLVHVPAALSGVSRR